MREYLNAILSFIGAQSLTDSEFDSVTLENTTDDLANYTQLSTILATREAVSDMQARLNAYYKAQGFNYAEPNTGRSNIFVGAILC